jgi:hypothetical protein
LQHFVFLIALLTVPTAYGVSIRGSGSVTVSVDPTGTYEVAVPDLSWSFSGTVGFPLANIQVATGVDGLGAYQEIAFDFQSDAARHASIRGYTDHADVLFTVSNPAGTAANSFTFPNLSKFPQNLDHIAFTGSFAPPVFSWLAPESPWVFFDSSFNTFILSPASNFMTAQTAWGPHGEMATGISPQIAALPRGFEHRTLLTFDKRIVAPSTVGNALTCFTERRGPPATPMQPQTDPATGPITARPITRWPPR